MNKFKKLFSKTYLAIVLSSIALLFSTQFLSADGGKYYVIVNTANSVDAASMTPVKARNLFLLKKRKWPNGKRIQPIYPPKNSETYKALLQKVLKKNERRLQDYWMHLKQEVGVAPPANGSSDAAVAVLVANSADAIAIVSAGTALPESVKIVLTVQ